MRKLAKARARIVERARGRRLSSPIPTERIHISELLSAP